MSKELANPFKQSSDTPADLSALAEQGFLPPEEIAKLKELEGRRNRSSEFGIRSSVNDVSLKEGMSAKERRKLQESKEDIRQKLIDWSAQYKLGDENWVDETFEINEDNTVICLGYLDLSEMIDSDFPPEIIEVRAGLYLDSLESAVGLTLPKKVFGGLYLNNLKSAEGLVLPDTIEHDLDLGRLASIDGLELTDIGGSVWLNIITKAELQELREKYPNLDIRQS